MSSENPILLVLQELGYRLKKGTSYYQTTALFRGGDNPTAVTIYPNSNTVIDFVTGEKFNIQGLLQRALNLKDTKEVEEWLHTKNIVIPKITINPRIKMPKIYSPDLLKQLIPVHDYWLDRGIDLDTIQLFKGGLSGNEGSMKHRYIFPVFDGKKQIIGFAGRDILNSENNKSRPKWMIKGPKNEFKWPLFLNHESIKKHKTVVLLESIGDCLALYSSGIHNVICMFGVECSLSIINLMIRYDLNKIIISTNNDAEGSNAGNEASKKIYNKLSKYFDFGQLFIELPKTGKDWGEVIQQENGKSIIYNTFNYF